eukprot:scaffold6641_cov270-Chaetoceros_neogracile.AAC.3
MTANQAIAITAVAVIATTLGWVLYMIIQTSTRKTNGKWPYAPILVLSGGLPIVLSSEFHGSKTSIAERIQKATLVRKGSVIKCSSPGATTRHTTVHVASDDVNESLFT